VSPDEVWIGGGSYMPSSSHLRLMRDHIATHHLELRRIVKGKRFRETVGELSGEQLSTMPRGYLKTHPAAAYLRFKQYLAGREFEATFATSDRFYPELLGIFSAVAPLIRLLNAPLLAQHRSVMPAPPRRA
jgi:uncharacterized protein (DUF2461 family)